MRRTAVTLVAAVSLTMTAVTAGASAQAPPVGTAWGRSVTTDASASDVAAVRSAAVQAFRPTAAVARRSGPALDPEEALRSPASWRRWGSLPANGIGAAVGAGQRVIDVAVAEASPLRLSVVTVQNTGAYRRAWSIVTGVRTDAIASVAAGRGSRVIDAEPYPTSVGLRWVVVLVRNSGVAAKAWRFVPGLVDEASVRRAAGSAWRPTRVVRYTERGLRRVAAVMIARRGPDAIGWQVRLTATESQLLTDLRRGWQLVSLQAAPSGGFDAVLAARPRGLRTWWWSALEQQDVVDTVAQAGARPYRTLPYDTANGVRYAVLAVDNASAEDGAIRASVGDGLSRARWGYFTRMLRGPSLNGLRFDASVDPASALKVLHLAYAMEQVQLGRVAVQQPITWWVNPRYPARYPTDPGYDPARGIKARYVCAYDDRGNPILSRAYVDSLGSVILPLMMRFSDNRATDALVRRWGFAAIDGFGRRIGLTDTALVSRIGCPALADPFPGERNRSTLVDLTRVMEWLDAPTSLSPANRAVAYAAMGGPRPLDGSLAATVEGELAAAGLPESVQRQFSSRTAWVNKPGSFSLPITGVTGAGGRPHREIRSMVATVWLPFRARRSGAVVMVPFAMAQHMSIDVDCTYPAVDAGTCSEFTAAEGAFDRLSGAQLRRAVRVAVSTWR